MAYFSESAKRLKIQQVTISSHGALLDIARNFNEACIVILPFHSQVSYGRRLMDADNLVAETAANLGNEATLITLGEAVDLVHIHAAVAEQPRYQHWIAIKRKPVLNPKDLTLLPNHHFGALIHTKYNQPLRHTKTRIAYTYCPVCDKTTKDYGGKKHTYHEYGTLLSDVWRDIDCNPNGDLTEVTERFSDLLGVSPYKNLLVLDCRQLKLKRQTPLLSEFVPSRKNNNGRVLETNTLIQGDCMDELKRIPDNTIDFAFADPPYNLAKKYTGYSDSLEITEYFKWCDTWLTELARVLRPGRICAVLNIPLWATRHFLHMQTLLKFQNWIAWDALSFPVRLIMPSHYTILCFSKGNPRHLPGLTGEKYQTNDLGILDSYKPLEPLAEGYCNRTQCVEIRKAKRLNDRGPLTDLLWDIHRLKHNSRRVDHPCQLPPQLMYRLISLFTKPGEVVLDCFNGAGTTTLSAHQIGRKYIGIESSKEYHLMALSRHEEILNGLDPFRKEDRVLTAKNSPVPRLEKQKYVVPKKVLQLEVRRIAKLLGHLPNRDEVSRHTKYPIEYYDKYFVSWGEVCAAARTTGMSENRIVEEKQPTDEQLVLLESRAAYTQKQSTFSQSLPRRARPQKSLRRTRLRSA